MGVIMNSNKLKSYFLGLILGLLCLFSGPVEPHCRGRYGCTKSDLGWCYQDFSLDNTGHTVRVPLTCKEWDEAGRLVTFCCQDIAGELF